MEHVEREKRELVYEGSILDVYRDTMRVPGGGTEIWDFVSHRKGAAAVVAAFPDGKLLLVRQYRPALERYTLELPAGARDSVTEDTLVCAKRELFEETGYKSENWKRLLSLKSTVAFCDELIDVYFAKDIYRAGEQHLDPSESIRFQAVELSELLPQVFSGKIQDSKTVAGILAYYTTLHAQD